MSYGTTDRITIATSATDNKLALLSDQSGELAIYSVNYNWTAGKPLRLAAGDSTLYLDPGRAVFSQPWGNLIIDNTLTAMRIRSVDDASGTLPLELHGTSVHVASGKSSFGGNVYDFQRLRVKSTGDNSSHYPFAVANTVENALFYIRGDGYPWVNQSWGIGSDERLKDDISDLGSELDRIRKVRYRSYRRKNSGRQEFGVVAQELRNIYPELVSEVTHPAHSETEAPETQLAVDYNGLAIAQGRALVELAEKLDAALARIAELEARG